MLKILIDSKLKATTRAEKAGDSTAWRRFLA